MRSTLTLLAAAVLLAAGCQVINPTVKQLETVKGQAAAGNYAATAQEPVTCKPDRAGCAQLHWIKADSCRRLVTDEPVELRRAHLDCAVENYEASLAGLARLPDPAVDRSQVELGLLDSLQRRRDVASDKADADRQNEALLKQAVAAQRGPNARPAGFYYAADAELNAVLRGPPSGGCIEIGRAAELLGKAEAQGTSFATPAAGLSQAIVNARKARGCAA
jgi:hypothetical protein